MRKFWRRILNWIDSHKTERRVVVVIAIVSLIWAVGSDVYSLILPGPTTSTETNTERTAEAAERVVETVQNLPNIVPIDPVIALSNRGYEFQKSSLYDAFESEDAVAINHFCEAAPAHWFGRSFLWVVRPSSTAIDALEKCSSFKEGDACELSGWKTDKNRLRDYIFWPENRRSLVSEVCGSRTETLIYNAGIDVRRDECVAFRSSAEQINNRSIQEDWNPSRTSMAWINFKHLRGGQFSYCKRQFGIDVLPKRTR